MFVVCSWCGRQKEKEKEPLENKAISHGMCPVCFIETMTDGDVSDLTPEDRKKFKEQIAEEKNNAYVNKEGWDAKISPGTKELYKELEDEVNAELNIGLKR